MLSVMPSCIAIRWVNCSSIVNVNENLSQVLTNI